ncbi:pullulanase-type alpha-1,6-glucosidase [Gilvimarinus sp. 1_MG-2023]|uniref:pullulanase-type alpha-1,6-glucosidase n=1 Tax=Gilvimarinus sp. 1_MG-2023 TaxID=3062638 RepID=UPI0026E27FC4|nr:pullulanase-type alpha-1,6-glucosidase [Gilvimarinus sp. 1_MG-2023]MDO6746760.1 pullulanase-type alpha-1,6-glucosidase [Gilvimarinus sp. 1_MG-2023]
MRSVQITCLLTAAILSACGGGNDHSDNHSSSSSSVASSSSQASSSSVAPGMELPVDLADDQAILFYQRSDEAYDGWGLHLWNDDACGALDADAIAAITWDSPLPASGVTDSNGAYYILDLNAPVADGGCFNFIVHSGDDKALGQADLVFDLTRGPVLLTQHGLSNLEYPEDDSGESSLPFSLSDTQAAIFYTRPDGDYDNWGLHLWNGGSCNALADNSINGITWDAPMAPTGIDAERGAYFILDLNEPGGCINFIVHQGDEKALGDSDGVFDLSQGNIAYTNHGSNVIVYGGDQGPAQVTQEGFSAHWVDTDTVLWNAPAQTARVMLHSDSNGDITVADNQLTGGHSIALSNSTVSSASAQKFPHLADWQAWKVDTTEIDRAAWLAGELVLAAYDSEDQLLKATGVQISGALDAYYANDAQLGSWISGEQTHFAVWSPTARNMTLEVFASATDDQPQASHPMTQDPAGVWSVSLSDDLHGAYYQYRFDLYHYATDQVESLTATDPYALNLSSNSRLAQVVDLSRPDTQPDGWSSHSIPPLDAPEDSVIYEVHIRDFSALDASTTESYRGKYLAFTEQETAPVQHLRELQQAGLNTIHLLPTFDIATVDEDESQRVDITDTVGDLCALNASATICQSANSSASLESILAGFDSTSGEAQALMNDIRGLDSFNWGYDPYHYTTPEGSYATSGEGFTRIVEFRQMVQALHALDLRVVMDVVYNHTNASGLADKSVLDKLVPGYYHRRNELSGAVEMSSCCDNTASEHEMMEKLMVDSLVVWADAYKIDGFRFDLMGHHMREDILAARDAVQAVDPDTYFYGEGWNFGEVANSRRGINAIQNNMAGTGVGSFNDRIRDAVRGGGPFDSGDAIRRNQGYGTGLYHYPNELNSGTADERDALDDLTDRLRVNLAGSLTSYSLIDRNGQTTTGGEVPYFDLYAGYTEDPQESINYISKHDNQTLWDNLQYKAPSAMTSNERMRMQNFSLSVPMLAQGIPFIHMGVDLLRSKSMQRDSYDSGDWFNRVDFTAQSNNWDVGLPREDKDGANWPLIQSILSNPNTSPAAADIEKARELFKEWLAIRASSPLFRLRDASAVQQVLGFHNTGPEQTSGVIVMSLQDTLGLDSTYQTVLVVFNPQAQSLQLDTPVAGNFTLHPVQQNSADSATRQANADGNSLIVPALTTAVFVQLD